jgi:hypothetical protein
MCALLAKYLGEPIAPPREHLVRILDAEGFAAMKEAAHDCPACILSALRTKNIIADEIGPTVSGPSDGRQDWSYKTAKVEWWTNFNDSLHTY